MLHHTLCKLCSPLTCIFVCLQKLVVTVGRHMRATNQIIRQGMPLYKGLLMTLWILATPDSFRSVAVKFGLEGGSVHNQYRTFIRVLRQLRSKFIRWPSDLEKARIARSFEDSFGYPGVIGCIDGTHVCMTAPLEDPQSYVNRHHDYSLTVQAVCDDQLIFRDVYVGEPGAVGDRRTFERSSLSKKMLAPGGRHMGDFHLLGDGAYPNCQQVRLVS